MVLEKLTDLFYIQPQIQLLQPRGHSLPLYFTRMLAFRPREFRELSQAPRDRPSPLCLLPSAPEQVTQRGNENEGLVYQEKAETAEHILNKQKTL